MREINMERILTCIVCPRGCQLTAVVRDGKVTEVTGNACKRGVTYAENECTNPVRTVTSTVKCEDGGIVAVKTDSTVPKHLVFEVMREINRIRAKNDVKIGDVIIENVLELGTNVVATSNKI
jgi:CxxC motif-containing protein